jgi:hypothetical protein
MLNFLKSKSSKIIISSFLILGFLASLNFKFDFLGSSKKNSGNGKIIAKVADIEISEGDLENVVANFKNEMMNQDQNNIMNLSDADEELLRKNILSGLINEKLFLKFIEKLDLNIDENSVI